MFELNPLNMDINEALKMLKQIIDNTVKAGLFQDAQSVINATTAYNVVAQEILAVSKEKAD